MAKEEGDAYPDPRKAGKCSKKALFCVILVFICFSSFIATVSAPGDPLPDPVPLSIPDPIFIGPLDGGSWVGNPIMQNQLFLQ